MYRFYAVATIFPNNFLPSFAGYSTGKTRGASSALQVEAERSTRSRRAAELGRARAKGALPARLAREGFLRAGYALADHTRNALILSVFAFKARALAWSAPLQTLGRDVMDISVMSWILAGGLGALVCAQPLQHGSATRSVLDPFTKGGAAAVSHGAQWH